MDFIPCSDYVEATPTMVPGRAKRANPDAIKDRYCQFVCSFDNSPQIGDETIDAGYVAWSLWDLPISHSAQIDDDRGDDLIVVSIVDRLYVLDWSVYRDEWDWNEFAPIYKMMRIGPVPSSLEDVAKGAWDVNSIKRFRSLQFSVEDEPTQGQLSRWRISIAEWNREAATQRITMRAASQRMNVGLTAYGKAFVVTLEHAANEPIKLADWEAVWDDLGRRVQHSRRVL